jgi:cytochrome c-type biogenesis protein
MRDLISTKGVWPSDADGKKTDGSRVVLAATFGIPALLVVGLLLLLISFQGGIETAVANLALLLPVGYAFAAGMVASVNPCGIMMLSSYAFYQVRSEGPTASAGRRAVWGLLIAVVVTLGFVVIFGAVGAIIAAGGQWLVRGFPYAGLILGAAMIGVGVWLLVTHRTLGFVAGKQVSVDPQRSLGNAFVFGVVYAVASLSCTLPIFLAVVGGSLVSGNLVSSLGHFVGYALGMGVVIFIVTIGAAVARRAMARWLRALTPYVHRLSAMFLIGAGVYLIYYWLFVGGLVF